VRASVYVRMCVRAPPSAYIFPFVHSRYESTGIVHVDMHLGAFGDSISHSALVGVSFLAIPGCSVQHCLL